MFNRVISLIFFAFFAFPVLAAATVLKMRDGDCNVGDIQCCNTTMSATSTNLSMLSGLLGLVLPSLGGLLGLNCSGLSVLGLGGNSCSAQPVCCSNNTFGGLISLGCIPINISL
ncbi:hypothetical protein CVT24_008990 [Panaeolus cyanescens]|uniref:Hydrophobin n=1 Tax=Panaeolus cyanescens TaxID=181874 RepID=A0A409YAQ3_9AGAR|nr:hypothetical protein CVT24_008990 [Panaeolus cyanescens]